MMWYEVVKHPIGKLLSGKETKEEEEEEEEEEEDIDFIDEGRDVVVS
jgi:hypothetical protein